MTVTAIGTVSTAAAAAAAGGSSGSASVPTLQAQLARCETQLADWTHCGSSKTPAGKKKIRELSDQVRALKQGIERAVAQKKPDTPGAAPGDRSGPATVTPPDTVPGVTASASSGGVTTGAYARDPERLVDVYA